MNKQNQGSESFKEYECMVTTVKCWSSMTTRQCKEKEEISNYETVAFEEGWLRPKDKRQMRILYI